MVGEISRYDIKQSIEGTSGYRAVTTMSSLETEASNDSTEGWKRFIGGIV